MSFLYNIHSPSKTFAIQHKDREEHSALLSRIASKAGLTQQDAASLREGKDGAGLVYEFKGSRWSLEDDDDLQIFLSRFPPSSTSSATFHLTPPHAHAHFSLPESPAKSKSQPSAASALKDKAKSPVKPKSTKAKSANGEANGDAPKSLTNGHGKAAGMKGTELGPVAPASKSNGDSHKSSRQVSGSSDQHHFPQASHSGNEHSEPAAEEPKQAKSEGGRRNHAHFAPSVRSTKSHRSKWGDDDAEPLWEVKKREWLEFQNGNGVRTVLGQVGDVKNVRMLLKPGYRGVYVSRPFAVKHGLVPKQFAMGTAGYTGLKPIGLVNITVAGKAMKHQTMVSEEEHFDVILGRAWVEKMNIKVDPIDQTILTYMDSGNSIPCDIVVLKDKAGNKIPIT